MKKTTATVAIFLFLVGCYYPTQQTVLQESIWEGTLEELKQAQESINFTSLVFASTEGFVEHWTLGSRSAWYSMRANEVLVIDKSDQTALKISDFPPQHGVVVATGWEDNIRFFVHLSPGADTGTMIYIDLEKRMVTRISHWASP